MSNYNTPLMCDVDLHVASMYGIGTIEPNEKLPEESSTVIIRMHGPWTK